jgi:hypothetical protein
MTWDKHQQYRLAVEKRILREHMPDFEFHDPLGDARVEGRWTSSRGVSYRLVVTVPPGFPDECPSCYVAEPCPLVGFHQEVTSYGNSHAMHTWTTDRAPWVRICTYRPERWSADHSIEKVLQKAMLWIEAYEAHCESGRPISAFLLNMD